MTRKIDSRFNKNSFYLAIGFWSSRRPLPLSLHFSCATTKEIAPLIGLFDGWEARSSN
jgi:hypothetical protein